MSATLANVIPAQPGWFVVTDDGPGMVRRSPIIAWAVESHLGGDYGAIPLTAHGTFGETASGRYAIESPCHGAETFQIPFEASFDDLADLLTYWRQGGGQ